MHEYGLAQQIISMAAEYAAGKRIKAINLVVGETSGCVADSIVLYFDLIAEGGSCEGAELNIERVKPMLKCKKCGCFFERKTFSFDCGCGGEGRPTEIGSEFYIRSIEVDGDE